MAGGDARRDEQRERDQRQLDDRGRPGDGRRDGSEPGNADRRPYLDAFAAGVIGSPWAASFERARAKAVVYFRREYLSLIEDRSSALLDRLLAAGVECSRTIR